MAKWSVTDIPDQRGRVALVTGASNGIGLATALELTRRGAHVIVHARDGERGARAIQHIRASVSAASLDLQLADLGDLDAVREMTERLLVTYPSIDLIINNAGTMMSVPEPTAQGYERHFGVNHLGHFALTLPLLPRLNGRADARVVSVSSLAHGHWWLDPDKLSGEGTWSYALYARSKLALTYFGLELDRRLRASKSPIKSVLAHPGFAGTNLAQGMARGLTRLWMTFVFPRFGQSLADGARPTLFAATMPGVVGGQFYGPDGIGELKGAPRLVRFARRAADPETARRLWTLSEQMTGVSLKT